VPTEKYNNLTDEELLESYYADGESKWLGVLFQRYTLLLFGVAMKYLKNNIEAQDAVQQVFLKSIAELKKHKVTYFKSWLYIVAKNHCLLMLRNKNIITTVPDELAIPDEETDFLSMQHNEKTLTAIEHCLPKLNKEQNTCLTLFYLQKKSYQEVSSITNYSLLQVKSHIQNGKRNLKILVENHLKQ
jgi:RNA polymerase sigma-70 factor (ECF subfamily)